MWSTNPLTHLLSIKYPIIQAPMAGGATTSELVAAVSNAGALGSLAAGYLSATAIQQTIDSIRKLTNNPFAVNLFIPEKHQCTEQQIQRMQTLITTLCPELDISNETPLPPFSQNFNEQIEVILEKKVPILSFTFGILDVLWIQKLKQNKVILIGTATNLEEALQLESHGIDIIVAQGSEAGGHRGTFIGKAEDALFKVAPLVTQLVHHLKTPIVAAGGIMTATNITEMLALKASGVQMGSAFLTCHESGIYPKYKERLLNLDRDQTTLTRSFSGKLARGLQNEFIIRMQPHEKEILDYPIQNALTRAMRKTAEQQNTTEFMSLWAGQHAYLCQDLSVRTLIDELTAGYYEEP